MINAPRQGSKKKAGRIILQVVFIILLFLTGLFHLKTSFMSQNALTRSIYLDTLSPFLTNPDTLAELAQREHYGTGDLDKAHKLYNRAINSFALHASSWLGLAELFNDLGRKNQAIGALKTLDTLKLDNADLMWSKAKLAHELNEGQILLSTLIRLADEDKVKRKKIFNLVGQTWDDPLFLMRNFKVRLYPDILSMYIRNNQLENAKTVWVKIVQNNLHIPKVAISYVNFLLEYNEFDQATLVWAYTYRKNGTLLFNGDFKQPIANAGFGWRASKSKSVSIEPAGPDEGLTIIFDGTENGAFQFVQTIPLNPGDHIFKGTFETNSLTSEQLPFWKITGHNCAGLFMKDLMVPPSEHLTEFEIPFTVPTGCKAIELALVRNKANKYDNFISGSITVNNLDITRISPPPVLFSVPEKPEVEQEEKPTGGPAVQAEPKQGEAPAIEQAEAISVKSAAGSAKEPVMETKAPTNGKMEKKSSEKIRTTIFINKMEIYP